MSYRLLPRFVRTWMLLTLAFSTLACSTESTRTWTEQTDTTTSNEDGDSAEDMGDGEQTDRTGVDDVLVTDSIDDPEQTDLSETSDQSDLGGTADQATDGVGDEGRDGSLDESDDLGPVLPPAPLRILFIGNSFTFGGPVPTIVDILANDAGWPDPHVRYSAFGGESLEGHRDRSATLDLVDEGSWDVVVLQEYSTRPTDGRGDPTQFKEDATWFHDRVKSSSPDARIILFETWAREASHSYYPGSYDDPADMQAQLRSHYFDAAENWIPDHAEELVVPDVGVAPVGDVWEQHLLEDEALRLHYSDDWHAGTNGRYLNGLVIYATIYQRAVTGLTPWELTAPDAARLQETTDAFTSYELSWGPDGTPPPLGLEPGQRIQVDFGGVDTEGGGWHSLDAANTGSLANMSTSEGEATSVDLAVSDGFGGVNNQGLEANELGYPGTASGDSFFCGSFDDHADGLTKPGQITLSGLDPDGRYDLSLFASRSGGDGAFGRLTRYSIGDQWRDLEVSDNTSNTASFDALQPSESGQIAIDVAVSSAGSARFCYLGVLELTGR